MAASPSLSHSSQDKAREQWWLQAYQGVSDECGSGVVSGAGGTVHTWCVFFVCRR